MTDIQYTVPLSLARNVTIMNCAIASNVITLMNFAVLDVSLSARRRQHMYELH